MNFYDGAVRRCARPPCRPARRRFARRGIHVKRSTETAKTATTVSGTAADTTGPLSPGWVRACTCARGEKALHDGTPPADGDSVARRKTNAYPSRTYKHERRGFAGASRAYSVPENVTYAVQIWTRFPVLYLLSTATRETRVRYARATVSGRSRANHALVTLRHYVYITYGTRGWCAKLVCIADTAAETSDEGPPFVRVYIIHGVRSETPAIRWRLNNSD